MKSLSDMESKTRSEDYVSRLLQKIETMKTVRVWNWKTGPGLVALKASFNESLFKATYAREKMEELHSEYEQFKEKQEVIVTAQNRLEKLYDQRLHNLTPASEIVDGRSLLDANDAQNWQVLIRVAKHLTREDADLRTAVQTYLNEFYVRYPSLVQPLAEPDNDEEGDGDEDSE
ncbi:hypothetical protein R3P38DRAFT_3220365 [Favolaschia claudopus]|uniref:Uncharacterized protein n=1 Tax=Favolaschia claudopus TaxID=2862362 RepID=A0AAW0A2T8_9AGAR